MASTYSDLGLELMATGENAGTWGTKTNANLNLIEQLTGGHLSVSIAGGAGTTALDIDDGALTGTAQQRVLELTGTITGNRIVTFPVLTENFYFIKNGTTGAYTVQLKAASGSGATVTYSTTDKGWKIIYLDGVATNTGLYQLNDLLSGLVVGTDVQAYDAQLADVAGLATTNGGFIVGDGSNFVLETGATARTSIGLGTADNVEFEDTQVDSFGVGTAASGTTGEIRATNDVTAFYSSDVALKENITNIPDPIEAIKKLNGVLFDWKKEYMDKRGGEDGYFVRKKDVGVIAQEVEKVLPEAVAQRPDGIKAVKYDRLTCLLIEAVKKLSAQVDSLTKKES
tara:strand:+ start:516 stop:1538 length:1023 start_codon:yes stop_codon:yes gene_type:complete